MSSNNISYYINQSSMGMDRFKHLTMDSFVNLQFRDYDKLGISEQHERQELYRIVNRAKKDYNSIKQSTGEQHVPMYGRRASVSTDNSLVLTESDVNKRLSGGGHTNEKPASHSVPNTHRRLHSHPINTNKAQTPKDNNMVRNLIDWGDKENHNHHNHHNDNHSINNDNHTQMVPHLKLLKKNLVEEPIVTVKTNPIISIRKQPVKNMIITTAKSTSSRSSHRDIPRIRVIVRKRPLNKKEKDRGEIDVVSVPREADKIIVHEPKIKVDLTKYVENSSFTFDKAFNETSGNEEIYEYTCKPLVKFFLDKGRCTCFAYGQTGSGKTHTMMGSGGGNGQQSGIYVLAARDIFNMIQTPQYSNYQIHVSFFEIYGGKLFDLLHNRQKLVMREDGQKHVNLVGLKEVRCKDAKHLMNLIAHGNGVRSTGQTGANIDSSRSHAILQMSAVLLDKNRKPVTKGKFSFIDLAGSERAADTFNNDRRTRLEGAEINKSLLALKECIRALDQDSRHQPFRGSKLTQVLRDSLIGNSKTIMIANISPNSDSCEHSLNTLRYADRVKELKNSGKKKAQNCNAYMPHQALYKGKGKHQPSAPDNNKKKIFDATTKRRQQKVLDYHIDGVVPQKKNKFQKVINPLPKVEENEILPTPRGHNDIHEFEFKSDPASPNMKEDLFTTHRNLCSTILQSEDDLQEIHRSQIDEAMRLVKIEMKMLKKLGEDTSSYDVDTYVNQLEDVLHQKVKAAQNMLDKVGDFRKALEEEDELKRKLAFNK